MSVLEQANACRMNRDYPRARALLEEALRSHPTDIRAWREVAAFMVDNKEYGRAGKILKAIRDAEPSNAEPRYQIAALYDTMGRWEKAERWAREACRLVHNRVGETLAYTILGDIQYKLGKTADAAASWDKALASTNNDGPSLFAKAEILLARGQWAEGWKYFEARWHTAEAWRTQKLHQTDLRSLPPEWDGIASGRVLVCAEQGTGDTLMMLRYVRWLAMSRDDVTVTLQCQPELVTFARDWMPSCCTIVPNGERGEADWSVPIMSLPLKGMSANPRNDGSPLPGPWPGWCEPRERTGAFRLGVCWKGSPDHGNDRDRSSPIDFRTAFAMDGVDVVSLQHGEPTRFRDFAATAEVIESCDAVVTVDTSVLHLAGTLGVPTYVIPPTRPELRFPLTSETTTPWYPSVTVVRRRKSTDWPQAIATVRELVARSV